MKKKILFPIIFFFFIFSFSLFLPKTYSENLEELINKKEQLNELTGSIHYLLFFSEKENKEFAMQALYEALNTVNSIRQRINENIINKDKFYCGGPLLDKRNGLIYETVQIGDQCWMADNLNYDDECNNIEWEAEKDSGWCGYHNEDKDGEKYGMFYQWSKTQQEICPEMWHVPTDNDFKKLEIYLGMSEIEANGTGWRQSGNVGSKLKARSDYWYNDCVNADVWDYYMSHYSRFNVCYSSKFNALPGGYRLQIPHNQYRLSNTDFFLTNRATYLWSSTIEDDKQAWGRNISEDYSGVNRRTYPIANSFSIRCIKQ